MILRITAIKLQGLYGSDNLHVVGGDMQSNIPLLQSFAISVLVTWNVPNYSALGWFGKCRVTLSSLMFVLFCRLGAQIRINHDTFLHDFVKLDMIHQKLSQRWHSWWHTTNQLTMSDTLKSLLRRPIVRVFPSYNGQLTSTFGNILYWFQLDH